MSRPPRKKKKFSLRTVVAGFRTHLLLLIVLFGVLLRLLYLHATPYDVRGRDTHGHVDYLRLMEDRLLIPPATAGWETFQPPLYYALGGIILRVADFFAASDEGGLRAVQWGSLFLSIVTLYASLRISRVFWEEEKNGKAKQLLFLSLICTLPGIVFLSAIINNDILLQTHSFLFLLFLLLWWKKGEHLDWLIACVFAGLTILTKSNGFLLLPIAFCCLLFRPHPDFSRRVKLGAAGLALIIVLTFWYPLLRFAQDHDVIASFKKSGNPVVAIVPNVQSLNGKLALTTNVSDFFIFNPVAFVPYAYNDPWTDEHRRKHFWEWMYRSAFLDEQHHGQERIWLARSMLTLGLLIPVLTLLGIASAVRTRWKFTVPLLFVILFLLAGQLVLRILAPFPSSQDFRYSTLLAVPLFAFTIQGLHTLPRIMKIFVAVLLILLIALSAAFIASFSLTLS